MTSAQPDPSLRSGTLLIENPPLDRLSPDPPPELRRAAPVTTASSPKLLNVTSLIGKGACRAAANRAPPVHPQSTRYRVRPSYCLYCGGIQSSGGGSFALYLFNRYDVAGRLQGKDSQAG